MAEDWDKPTILRKSRPTTKEARSGSAVNRAMAAGNVEVTKKCTIGLSSRSLIAVVTAGTNKHPGTDVNLAKVDQQTEVAKGIQMLKHENL
jgi:hypothetical protein